MVDRTGQRLDNYTLIRLLGHGNFGEVYLGEHLQRKVQVAIKILQPQISQEEFHDFINEARVFRLRHPNIVAVLDFGIEKKTNTPFIVMDYAPNGTLRRRHTKGEPISLAVVTEYVEQVAAALQHAHDDNLIHRDIKPENMLIGPADQVLLSDFGIAIVAQGGRSSHLSMQQMAGTPFYMAPEQFMGKPGRASDQYALGIVAYEWLTGNCPFIGTLYELIGQHLHVIPPPLPTSMLMYTPEVERVVMKALAKEPKERFSRVEEFARALKQAYQRSLKLYQTPTLKKTKEQWLTQGKAYQDEGRLQDALAACNFALQLDPDYTDAYIQRGEIYINLHELEAAVDDFSYTIKLDEEATNAYKLRAVAYFGLQQPQQTLADLNLVLTRSPQTIIAMDYHLRGLAHAAIGEYEQAVEDHSEAIRLTPQNPELYKARGLAYHYLKLPRLALADFEQAIQSGLQEADLYLMQGVAYADVHEELRAIESYTHALAFDINAAKVYCLRAVAYLAVEDYSQALVDFNLALQLQPDLNEAMVYNERGLAYYYIQEYQLAIDSYSRAIELDLGNALAYLRRGMCHYLLEDLRQALADLDCALDLDPQSAEGYHQRGAIHYQLKEYMQAVADLDRALELNIMDTEAYYLRGQAHHQLNEVHLALMNYNCVIELDKDYRDAYLKRGMLYYQLEKYQQALADFDYVVSQTQQNAVAYHYRGLVFIAQKSYQKAVAELNRTVELNARAIAAYNDRGMAYFYLHNYQQALVDFEQAIQQASIEVFYCNRGVVYLCLQQYTSAIADFDYATGENTGRDFASVDAYYHRAIAYARLKKYEQASADFTQAIELVEQRGSFYSHTRQALPDSVALQTLREYQYNPLVQKHNLMSMRDLFLVAAYYYRGKVYYQQQDFSKALDDFEQVLSIAPYHQEAQISKRQAQEKLK